MERAVNFFFGLLGYLLFGFVLSMETTRYLYIHTDIWQPYKPAYLNGAALTAIWFVLALLFLQIGFLCKSKKMITTGFCGLTLTALRMFFLDFISRIDTSAIPLDDPFCYGLIAESVILLLLGIQAYFDKENHDVLGAFSIFGMFLLPGILSVEWLLCVDIRLEPLLKRITPIHVPVRSLSVLWTVYALLWLGLGFALRIFPLRVCGMVILFFTIMKAACIDSWTSYQDVLWGYDNECPRVAVNPYFMTMLCPVIPALLLAVWTNRLRTAVDEQERAAWKMTGIFGTITLLIYASVECYEYYNSIDPVFFGTASLTVFWTVAATVFAGISLYFRSPLLRCFAVVILWFALLKALLVDLMQRPDYLMPFWNAYAVPMIAVAVMLTVLGHLFYAFSAGDDKKAERGLYRFFIYGGVVFLWLVMSAECFQSVQLLQTDHEAWKAQMALSILWSVFAGVLILIGFLFRSPVLRWMAITLFAMTLLKILVADMAGMNELYRFGAVFGLAMVLSLAAWAYQRFKPENPDKNSGNG